MQFRTEISLPSANIYIKHEQGIVMLGSCFTDNIGELLCRDGFAAMHNPMGPLFNPASLYKALEKAISGYRYSSEDFLRDEKGIFHCLDFASRYSGADSKALANAINEDLETLRRAIEHASYIFLTLGTSYVFELNTTGEIVGNCHKFPSNMFTRRKISVEEATQYLEKILEILPSDITNVIFTVSPIRHLADGLHGNQISKATLLLSIENLHDPRVSYFPSYEIMLDDLRDYRFYAADMKHPSEVAVEYIYEKFGEHYFSAATQERAKACRKQWLSSQHRPILQ